MELNEGVLRVLVDETVDRAAQKTRVPKLFPGTVAGDPLNPQLVDPALVDVTVDGDTVPIVARSVIGHVWPGARVIVMFVPPSGAMITGLVPEPWQQLGVGPYDNGWTDAFGTFPLVSFPRYRREVNGVLRLEGHIVGGTIGLAAFTLPEGYRPSPPGLRFAVDADGGHGTLYVDAFGHVIPLAGSNVLFGLNVAWSLT